ncbi:MAG: T9SS type A sorting domain-containing protein, partial [Flavobacteriales bacterium]|nr:T9SS type A sorting domain-containing protein [Flavobacteriales bacterium]
VTRDFTKVGLDEFSSMDVLIYPNPARDYFTVDLLGNSNDNEYTFKLKDSRARVLRESTITNSIVIERGDLASGIYFISVENGTKIIRQKILFAEKK